MENYQKAISFDDFFVKTAVTFKGCKTPKRKPDYISSDPMWGLISSQYWYGKDSHGEYVIRCSDHWEMYFSFEGGKNKQCNSIGGCRWHLKSNKKSFILIRSRKFYSGKAYLSKFTKI